MASSRETNTMAEGCRGLLNQITKMKVEPDADMQFLLDLETQIISYLKAPTPDQAGQQQQQPDMGALGGAMGQVMGQPASMPMGAPMGAPMGGGAPMMSAGPGPGMPNPDELRRMLGNSALRSSVRDIAHRLVP